MRFRHLSPLVLLFALSSAHAGHLTCKEALQLIKEKGAKELLDYEATRILDLKPIKDLKKFQPSVGFQVTSRNADGRAAKVNFKFLVDRPNVDVRFYGDFNNWDPNTAIRLTPDTKSLYYSTVLTQIKDGESYGVLVDGQEIFDPGATFFGPGPHEVVNESAAKVNRPDGIHPIFWDFDGPGHYKAKYKSPDLRTLPVAISENELYSLVKNWEWNGQKGPKTEADTYKFISESGVIQQLKAMGKNAIEILPFVASMDPDRWAWRYQAYGIMGIDGRYGNPDELMEMIDSFHKEDFVVILDVLASHFPIKGNKNARSITKKGIHNLVDRDGNSVFADAMTPWGTRRFRYSNPAVSRILKDGVLFFMKTYGIRGTRMDNFDGIVNTEGGPQFLKEFTKEIRDYAPETQNVPESYETFKGVAHRLDRDGYGSNAYTNAFFFHFVRDSSQLAPKKYDLKALRRGFDKAWNVREFLRVFFVTNHDESANPLPGASGAYMPTLWKNPRQQLLRSAHRNPRIVLARLRLKHDRDDMIQDKLKLYGAAAILSGSYHLDTPQYYLGQEGDFNRNPAVEWDRLKIPEVKEGFDFLSRVSNYYIDNPHFAFYNLSGNVKNHIDDTNKLFSIERIDLKTSKRILVLYNLNNNGFDHYTIPVRAPGQFKVVIGSKPELEGQSFQSTPGVTSHLSEGDPADYFMTIPYIPPYGVLVLEQAD